MKYRVVHTTEYRYGESVPLCHNVIHLRPRDTRHQTCLRSTLTISPAPAVQRHRVDFFGNHATWVSLQEPHDTLSIRSTSEVDVKPIPLPAGVVGPSWEAAARMLDECRRPDLYLVREYVFASPHVTVHADLADYARPSFASDKPLMACMLDLTQRIFKEFTFDRRATTVGTPVLEVLRNRRGVCQDFAHLQIGCLRSLGLAARYVSGYVITRPPPGQQRLVGCDASHAWVSGFIPDIGWVDYDPTNGVMPSLEHVTLGWGRDYGDVSPVKGVLIGGDRHSLSYGVDVEPIDADGKPASDQSVAVASTVSQIGVTPTEPRSTNDPQASNADGSASIAASPN